MEDAALQVADMVAGEDDNEQMECEGISEAHRSGRFHDAHALSGVFFFGCFTRQP